MALYILQKGDNRVAVENPHDTIRGDEEYNGSLRRVVIHPGAGVDISQLELHSLSEAIIELDGASADYKFSVEPESILWVLRQNDEFRVVKMPYKEGGPLPLFSVREGMAKLAVSSDGTNAKLEVISSDEERVLG